MAGSISALIPEFQPWARALVDAAGAAGLQPRVTSTLRTRAEQARLYRRYLEGLSQFPAAPPGRSAHEYGYALDLVVAPLDALYDVGAWWQEQGGVWHESDAIHFEYPGFKAAAGPTNGISLNDVKDFVATLPVPFSATIAGWLFEAGFGESTITDLVLHPSRAVEKYPWLRALGPPFMFY